MGESLSLLTYDRDLRAIDVHGSEICGLFRRETVNTWGVVTWCGQECDRLR